MAAIIFDFDGTIADSFETVVEIFHELTGRQHQALPADEIERLRGMSLTHAAEDLRVPPWKWPFLMVRGRRRMARQLRSVKAHEGVPGVIRKLYDEGHQLFIVSSNSQKNIYHFLAQHHLGKEFVRLYGNVGLLNKAGVLKKVLRQNALETAGTWYVGDEVRDIAAAHAAGLKIASVAWGYNTPELLARHQPDKLITTPAELLALLEEI